MSEENNNSSKKEYIVKKVKSKNHSSHHGGMWKVAYADFVTAMMAFFLLMWLVNAVSKDSLQGVAKYFTPAVGLKGQSGAGIHGGKDPSTKQGMQDKSLSSVIAPGVPEQNLESQAKSLLNDAEEKNKFVTVMNNLERAMEKNSDLKNFAENFMITIKPEGLQIQLMDSINRPIFKPGTPQLEPYVHKFLSIVATLIGTLPNYISIEGHTSHFIDEFVTKDNQWELSANRANEIRRVLYNQTKKDQVIRIIGKSDKEPYDPEDLTSPKNVRVVLTLLNRGYISEFQKAVPDSFLNLKK